MKRPTLSDIEYARRKRKTKREEFFHIINEVIPWDDCIMRPPIKEDLRKAMQWRTE